MSLEETLPGFAPAEFLQLQMELAVFQRPITLFRLDALCESVLQVRGLPLMPMATSSVSMRTASTFAVTPGGTSTYMFTSSRV